MVTPGSKIPNITRIVLNPALSEPQRMLLVQYQRRSQTLTADEWAAALVAIDVLGESWLEVEGQYHTCGENLVMVTYSDWKARVRAWQARQTGENE
jgi:hypothetical protein